MNMNVNNVLNNMCTQALAVVVAACRDQKNIKCFNIIIFKKKKEM